MSKISTFKRSKSIEPSGQTTVEEWLKGIKEGQWKKQILSLRQKTGGIFKAVKKTLPCATISGQFKSRNVQIPLKERFISHSGFIAIDLDRKDNPKMRVQDLVDKDCYAQFVSASGEGKKIIYRCTPVKTAEEHRRIYDAIVERLVDKGIKLKVDPVVKSIIGLQYVSFDPELYLNTSTKLIIKPLPPVKAKQKLTGNVQDIDKELEQLGEYVDQLGDRDVTKTYEDWLIVMLGLSYSFGERGRDIMHRLCANYPNYSREECDEKYDACLERQPQELINPVTLASVYQLVNSALPKVTLKQLARKHNKGHAVGVGEDEPEGEQQSDLQGLVRYKLFLFKKGFDKDTNTLAELTPHSINWNAFESLLRSKGFYRFGKLFVHIVDNVVETVDIPDILRVITNHIEQEGDYKFIYKKIEFFFSWEELAHLWRTIRAYGTTPNQISASLTHWIPNVLEDEPDCAYIPYQNGVVKVTADKVELLPYNKLKCESCKLKGLCTEKCNKLNKQIWKERILPREFNGETKVGMFEQFFANVCGRGKTEKEKVKSPEYLRSLWYFGYILHTFKKQSVARAWMLYDTKNGNSGRTGKTILGQAVGKIRSVVTIDGKQVDFRNRFAFQQVTPWTDVVFIDDPSKYMSIVPMFNMISGTLVADRKTLSPVEKAVKFIIASNWVLETNERSEAGRQFVTQVSDYYAQYAKDNSNTLTPVVDIHGKEFFTEWDKRDWGQFDSFAVKALQNYFSAEPPESTIIGNALQLRFIQVHEEELFYELCVEFCRHVKRSAKDGSLLIPQKALTSLIKEKGELGDVKSGKVAREFLISIGAKGLEVTSMAVGSLTQMAYKLHNSIEELEWGQYKDKLPQLKL